MPQLLAVRNALAALLPERARDHGVWGGALHLPSPSNGFYSSSWFYYLSGFAGTVAVHGSGEKTHAESRQLGEIQTNRFYNNSFLNP
jgi:hypothetical protein